MAEGLRRLGDLLGEEWEVAPYADAATLAPSAARGMDGMVGLRDRAGGEVVPVLVEAKTALTPAAARRLTNPRRDH